MDVAHHPKEKAVVSCLQGGVYSIGSGSDGMEDPLPINGATTRLQRIEQDLYACGTRRQLYRRVDGSSWERVGSVLPCGDDRSSYGFHAVDGFVGGDIYAVGGHGDVLRFDGTDWHPCGFPTDMPVTAVCCAGDGFIYVGSEFGHVFKGRNDTFRRIHEGSLSLPFRDMVWHDGRVWCTNDYGLWLIEDDQLSPAEVDPAVKACSGNLAVGDGVMLLAGYHGAAVLANGKWKVLYDRITMKNASAGGQAP